MWFWHKPRHRRVAPPLGWPFPRPRRPRAQALRFRSEKAGLSVSNEPIPWNAEAVLVEAVVALPDHGFWPKSDFYLDGPGGLVCPAVELLPGDRPGIAHVRFRLLPLRQATVVRLCWRSRLLDQVLLPYLTAAEFVHNLRLEAPTLFARLGEDTVACRALVGGQGYDLLACALLKSPTSLVPLLDLNLAIEFAGPCAHPPQNRPVPLTGSQVAARQALLCVAAPWWPCGAGSLSARWRVADRLLAHSEVRLVSPQALQQSLHVAEARFASAEESRPATTDPHQPLGEGPGRSGPGFLVASREPGLAARCPVEVRVHYKDGARRAGFLEKDLLVTDVPALLVPAPLTADDRQRIHAFELVSNGQLVGVVPVCPAPIATFTSEGGFLAPTDYPWTVAAEGELDEHLSRLMEAAPE
jgi:hypothetical protein